LIVDMPAYRGLPAAAVSVPNARRIADRILCLPIFPDLTDDIVDGIVGTLRDLVGDRKAA
jgi:dTDP-4-amino-4,6-dideoxygalactose transaminase